ncbi:hypothetical protein ACFLTD_04025, partial [Elusimicrobiota bacterium]
MQINRYVNKIYDVVWLIEYMNSKGIYSGKRIIGILEKYKNLNKIIKSEDYRLSRYQGVQEEIKRFLSKPYKSSGIVDDMKRLRYITELIWILEIEKDVNKELIIKLLSAIGRQNVSPLIKESAARWFYEESTDIMSKLEIIYSIFSWRVEQGKSEEFIFSGANMFMFAHLFKNAEQAVESLKYLISEGISKPEDIIKIIIPYSIKERAGLKDLINVVERIKKKGLLHPDHLAKVIIGSMDFYDAAAASRDSEKQERTVRTGYIEEGEDFPGTGHKVDVRDVKKKIRQLVVSALKTIEAEPGLTGRDKKEVWKDIAGNKAAAEETVVATKAEEEEAVKVEAEAIRRQQEIDHTENASEEKPLAGTGKDEKTVDLPKDISKPAVPRRLDETTGSKIANLLSTVTRQNKRFFKNSQADRFSRFRNLDNALELLYELIDDTVEINGERVLRYTSGDLIEITGNTKRSIIENKEIISYLKGKGGFKGSHIARIIRSAKDKKEIIEFVELLQRKGIKNPTQISMIIKSTRQAYGKDGADELIDHLRKQGFYKEGHLSSALSGKWNRSDMDEILKYLIELFGREASGFSGAAARILYFAKNKKKVKNYLNYIKSLKSTVEPYGIKEMKDIALLFWTKKSLEEIENMLKYLTGDDIAIKTPKALVNIMLSQKKKTDIEKIIRELFKVNIYEDSYIANIMLSAMTADDTVDMIKYLADWGITDGSHVGRMILKNRSKSETEKIIKYIWFRHNIREPSHICDIFISSRKYTDIRKIVRYLKDKGIQAGYHISSMVCSPKTYVQIKDIIDLLHEYGIKEASHISRILRGPKGYDKIEEILAYLHETNLRENAKIAFILNSALKLSHIKLLRNVIIGENGILNEESNIVTVTGYPELKYHKDDITGFEGFDKFVTGLQDDGLLQKEANRGQTGSWARKYIYVIPEKTSNMLKWKVASGPYVIAKETILKDNFTLEDVLTDDPDKEDTMLEEIAVKERIADIKSLLNTDTFEKMVKYVEENTGMSKEEYDQLIEWLKDQFEGKPVLGSLQQGSSHPETAQQEEQTTGTDKDEEIVDITAEEDISETIIGSLQQEISHPETAQEGKQLTGDIDEEAAWEETEDAVKEEDEEVIDVSAEKERLKEILDEIKNVISRFRGDYKEKKRYQHTEETLDPYSQDTEAPHTEGPGQVSYKPEKIINTRNLPAQPISVSPVLRQELLGIIEGIVNFDEADKKIIAFLMFGRVLAGNRKVRIADAIAMGVVKAAWLEEIWLNAGRKDSIKNLMELVDKLHDAQKYLKQETVLELTGIYTMRSTLSKNLYEIRDKFKDNGIPVVTKEIDMQMNRYEGGIRGIISNLIDDENEDHVIILHLIKNTVRSNGKSNRILDTFVDGSISNDDLKQMWFDGMRSSRSFDMLMKIINEYEKGTLTDKFINEVFEYKYRHVHKIKSRYARAKSVLVRSGYPVIIKSKHYPDVIPEKITRIKTQVKEGTRLAEEIMEILDDVIFFDDEDNLIMLFLAFSRVYAGGRKIRISKAIANGTIETKWLMEQWIKAGRKDTLDVLMPLIDKIKEEGGNITRNKYIKRIHIYTDTQSITLNRPKIEQRLYMKANIPVLTREIEMQINRGAVSAEDIIRDMIDTEHKDHIIIIGLLTAIVRVQGRNIRISDLLYDQQISIESIKQMWLDGMRSGESLKDLIELIEEMRTNKNRLIDIAKLAEVYSDKYKEVRHMHNTISIIIGRLNNKGIPVLTRNIIAKKREDLMAGLENKDSNDLVTTLKKIIASELDTVSVVFILLSGVVEFEGKSVALSDAIADGMINDDHMMEITELWRKSGRLELYLDELHKMIKKTRKINGTIPYTEIADILDYSNVNWFSQRLQYANDILSELNITVKSTNRKELASRKGPH